MNKFDVFLKVAVEEDKKDLTEGLDESLFESNNYISKAKSDLQAAIIRGKNLTSTDAIKLINQAFRNLESAEKFSFEAIEFLKELYPELYLEQEDSEESYDDTYSEPLSVEEEILNIININGSGDDMFIKEVVRQAGMIPQVAESGFMSFENVGKILLDLQIKGDVELIGPKGKSNEHPSLAIQDSNGNKYFYVRAV